MKIKYFLLFIFFLTSRTPYALAQVPVFKSFDIRSENTRPRIVKLLLDHNGRIWTGTDKGLFTFDGINFSKIIQTDTSQSFVSALYEDESSNIWVGYENGNIICLKNQNLVPLNIEGKFPAVSISAFCEDDSGRIYFSTKGEGVYYFENKKVYRINQDDGLSDNYCYDIIKLSDGRLCVATDDGLNFIKVSGGKKLITTIRTSDGLPDDIVRALTIDAQQNLIIGFQENGFSKFDIKKNKLIQQDIVPKWMYGQINNLTSKDGYIYFATEEKGIIVLSPKGNFNRFYLENDKNIKTNDMLFDSENNFWITESIHLIRTSGNKISFLHSAGKKPLKFIHCITSDNDGNIWFSPDQQLGKLHMTEDGQLMYKEFTVIDKPVDIVTLYFDPFGFLWIGTMGEGVYRFNPRNNHVRKVFETSNTENSSILSINGRGDVIWVAGFNSVMKFIIRKNGESDNALIEKEPAFNESKLMNDYVYSIFIDSRNRTWFATDGSGIYRYDGKELLNFPVPGSAVHSMTEDKKGRLWFSTTDAGLQYIDTDQKIKYFQVKDGLSDPSPTSLILTNTGNILVVNSNGFDVLNPETKNVVYHSSEENLSDINCDLNSITSSPDNIVWIGTERGIIQYSPDLDTSMQMPKIALRSVSVYLENIDFTGKNIFKSDENNFKFEYDGIWYSDPQRVNYLFILDGYSGKWVQTKDHTTTFPKLPPGNYTFRVKAALNNNFEKAAEASYSFEITPPFWQQWWFRILVAGGVAVFILSIIKRRENRLRKFERLQKEKIEFQFETLKSQVNPHFLFNSFNTLISVIEDTPKNAIEYVEKLSEFFRNIVTYRDKNLISVREELELLENYIFIQKKRYGNNLVMEIILDENTRTNKYLAPLTLQLLVENAIKHNEVSKESKLTIKIITENENLKISNNINPKIAKEKSAGFGLQNIKSMYKLLTSDEVRIISTENNFTVLIPLLNL